MKIFALFLVLFYPVISLSQKSLNNPVPLDYGWKYLGNQGFSLGEVQNTTIAYNLLDEPYAAFNDYGFSGNITVKKFCDGNWLNIDTSGIPYSSWGDITLLFNPVDSLPYIAFPDGSGQARVMKFNGSSWVHVGQPGFSNGRSDFLNMAFNSSGEPFVVYQDSPPSYKFIVRKYDRSNWVYVGQQGSYSENAYNTDIVVDSSGVPFVSFKKFGALSVMKFNGTDWVYVGSSGFLQAQVYDPILSLNPSGQPVIAFKDGDIMHAPYGKASVMKFNGTDWINIGPRGFSAGEIDWLSMIIGSSGQPCVVFSDWANSLKATVMEYDGNSWKNVGPPGFSESWAGYTRIARNSS